MSRTSVRTPRPQQTRARDILPPSAMKPRSRARILPPAGLLTVPAVSPSRPPLSCLSRGQHRGWGNHNSARRRSSRGVYPSWFLIWTPAGPWRPNHRAQRHRRVNKLRDAFRKTKVKLNNNDQQEVAGRRIRFEGQPRCPISGPASH
ncbi:hypothetical protein FQA47_009846 [Oryzias melastigma]|uniref:Uncharacterized protein n=1 Tax=Oryzias melastigma TaxID=30732 RepID=A0A834F852_ORYME|nr:hypothetical protein FQA47_009846 [Oryzias melastigma]